VQITIKVNAASGGSSDPVGDTIYQYASGDDLILKINGSNTNPNPV